MRLRILNLLVGVVLFAGFVGTSTAQIDMDDLDPNSLGRWLDSQFVVEVTVYGTPGATYLGVTKTGNYTGSEPPHFQRVECHGRLGCAFTGRRYATLEELKAAEGTNARWRFNNWFHDNKGLGWQSYTTHKNIYASYDGHVAGYHIRHGRQTGNIHLQFNGYGTRDNLFSASITGISDINESNFHGRVIHREGTQPVTFNGRISRPGTPAIWSIVNDFNHRLNFGGMFYGEDGERLAGQVTYQEPSGTRAPAEVVFHGIWEAEQN